MTENTHRRPGTGLSIDPDEPVHVFGGGWQRHVFPAFWLIYLAQTVDGVTKHSSGAGEIAGFALLGAFAFVYLTALPVGWGEHKRFFWTLVAIALALTAALCFFAHDDAMVCLVYVGVLLIASRHRFALQGVAALTVASGVVPALIFGRSDVDWSIPLSVALVGLAMYGFFHIVRSNVALSAARSEVARLAAENERSRIARDLHDLLGHSLTTITVKAGLARRLGETGETGRALAEIAEVEQLSRRTLGDVRAAVSANREVNLVNELATAGEVLRAAGVVGELPPSVADTDPELSELFGWIVREGITNVVRHARAQHVRIEIDRRSVEIVDDGIGPGPAGDGNGLRGLRERVEGAGGTLVTDGSGRGFRLRVEVPVRREPALDEAPAPRRAPAHDSPGVSRPAGVPAP